MNRRNLIKGFAGLAALAVAGPTLAKLTQTDRDRLMAQMVSGGVIENQTFLIPGSGPIEIGEVDALMIRNCLFLWQVPVADCYVRFLATATNVTFDSCAFYSRDFISPISLLHVGRLSWP